MSFCGSYSCCIIVSYNDSGSSTFYTLCAILFWYTHCHMISGQIGVFQDWILFITYSFSIMLLFNVVMVINFDLNCNVRTLDHVFIASSALVVGLSNRVV